jgi:hypothetical protein
MNRQGSNPREDDDYHRVCADAFETSPAPSTGLSSEDRTRRRKGAMTADGGVINAFPQKVGGNRRVGSRGDIGVAAQVSNARGYSS